MRKKYNTPHRSRVVKTRLSEDEYADFTARLAPYGISQSEFLRQAIRRTTIRPVVHVSAVNDELLSAVGKLAAEYGRIGGNLNQIARYKPRCEVGVFIFGQPGFHNAAAVGCVVSLRHGL